MNPHKYCIPKKEHPNGGMQYISLTIPAGAMLQQGKPHQTAPNKIA